MIKDEIFFSITWENILIFKLFRVSFEKQAIYLLNQKEISLSWKEFIHLYISLSQKIINSLK
jgi:hypothetical protein